MCQVIAELERDHANIAKLLDFVESEILAIGVGKTPDYALLQGIMRYMTQCPDRFHHPKEDVVFAQVLKCVPGARANIEALVDEHDSIGLAGRKFDRLLHASAVDSVDVREQLVTAANSYIRALREHMLKEERNLFALAKAVLSETDWRDIDEQVDAIEDPLFDAMIGNDYEQLYNWIISEQAISTV